MLMEPTLTCNHVVRFIGRMFRPDTRIPSGKRHSGGSPHTGNHNGFTGHRPPPTYCTELAPEAPNSPKLRAGRESPTIPGPLLH